VSNRPFLAIILRVELAAGFNPSEELIDCCFNLQGGATIFAAEK